MEAVAKLRKYSVSPRKVRLLVDMVRGRSVTEARYLLKFSDRQAAKPLEKLLLAALASWKGKNEEAAAEQEAALYIKAIHVDGAGMLKRIRPAPQGRAHRIRKRSNHVTLVIGERPVQPIEESKAKKAEKVEKKEKKDKKK